MADSRSITRRLFMRHGAAAGAALSTLAATAAPGAVLAATGSQVPELPIDRVHLLAEELSDALATWEAEIAATGYPRAIECTVHAARQDGIRPIRFSPIRHFTPDQRVENAQRELVDATKACHPEVSDWRVLRPDDEDGGNIAGMFMILGHRECLS